MTNLKVNAKADQREARRQLSSKNLSEANSFWRPKGDSEVSLEFAHASAIHNREQSKKL